jgi:hypothetical protein
VDRPRDGASGFMMRSRRIHRSLISTGTATYGPGIPPPKPGDPGRSGRVGTASPGR